MTPLIVTRKHFRNLLLIFCSTLVITTFCEKKTVFAKEKSSPAKQVGGKHVVVEVNGVKLTQNEIDAAINTRLKSIKGARPKKGLKNYG